jgi:hypothetical protein
MNYKRSDFPEDFLFGTATSAYQIEGHGFGGAGPTHWDTFAATPGNVVRAENGAVACDHYHRYEEDFDLLKAAGFDTYRFSTSWARILPEGRGTPNPEGLAISCLIPRIRQTGSNRVPRSTIGSFLPRSRISAGGATAISQNGLVILPKSLWGASATVCTRWPR